MSKGIRLSQPGTQPGQLHSIRVQETDLPGILPAGSRCHISSVSPNKLKLGDVVATPSGQFRRFWSTDGKQVWVTDQTGLAHESHPIQRGLVQKVLCEVRLSQTLLWFMGALLGRIKR